MENTEPDLFRLAVETTGLLLSVSDAAGGMLRLSPEFARWLGRGVSLPLDEFWTMVHPEDRARVQALYSRALAEGGDFTGEHRLVPAAGDTRWVSVSARALRGDTAEAGRAPSRVLWATRDITARMCERERAEQRLRDSEKRFRQLADAMPQLVWIARADGVVTYYNQRAARFGGIVHNQDGTWSWQPVVHPDNLAETQRAWETAVAEGGMYQCEHRLQMADGTYRWHLSRAERFGADGAALWFGTATEVHDLKEAEDRLRASEERLRLAADAARFGAYDLYPGTGETRWSDTLRELMGLPAGAPSSVETAAALVHPDDRGVFERTLRRALDPNGPGAHEAEYRIVRPDGEVRWMHDTGRTSFDGAQGSRRVVRVVGTLQDITDRKQTELALQQARALEAAAARQKDQFIAVLAHELRNPLAPIRTSVALLHARGPKDPLLARCRDVIERQAAHMGRLLDDLLDVSRLSRGKLTLQRAPVLLHEALESAVEVSRPWIEQHRHTLTVDEAAHDALIIDADPARVIQVFGNLLNNAAKFTPPGGRIHIGVRRDGADVEVSVRDSGIGMTPEILGSAFELFTQGNAAGHGGAGLGIGLALARMLAEMHGGSIRAVSQGPGLGSEFIVRLPVGEAASAPTPPPPIFMANERWQGTRVLVADDNADAADMLSLLFEQLGCDVRSVSDGASALRAAREFLPHIVLLDIGMPGLDGFEVCRRVRAESWGGQMLLFALTGWGQEQDRMQTRAAGFDAHVVKPVEPAALVRQVAGMCQRLHRAGADAPRM